MSNDNRYWALILHLRPHQITQRHRPVVFAEDYDALAAENAALRKDAELCRRILPVLRRYCEKHTPDLLAEFDAAMEQSHE